MKKKKIVEKIPLNYAEHSFHHGLPKIPEGLTYLVYYEDGSHEIINWKELKKQH